MPSDRPRHIDGRWNTKLGCSQVRLGIKNFKGSTKWFLLDLGSKIEKMSATIMTLVSAAAVAKCISLEAGQPGTMVRKATRQR